MRSLAALPLAAAFSSAECNSIKSCEDCYAASWWCVWCHSEGEVDECRGRGERCSIGSACTPAETCFEQKTCNACNKVSGCHWCEDNSCHAMGSVYGCATGVSCLNTTTDCIREIPQPVPYAPAPSWVSWVATLILTISLASCGCCIGCCAKLRLEVKRAARGAGTQDRLADYEADAEDVSLADVRTRGLMTDEAAVVSSISNRCWRLLRWNVRTAVRHSRELEEMRSTRQEAGAQTGSYQRMDDLNGQSLNDNLLEDDDAETGSTMTRARESGDARTVDLADRMAKFCFRCTWISLSVLWLLLALFVGATALHYPHVPQYCLCNTKLDWASIMQNIKTVITSRLYANEQLLISVSNPNRFDLNVTSLTGIMYSPATSATRVGGFTVDPQVLPAGTISDLLGTMSLDLDRWAALDLLTEYTRGTLTIGVETTASFEVGYGGWGYTPPFQVSTQRSVIKWSDPWDLTLCKCDLETGG